MEPIFTHINEYISKFLEEKTVELFQVIYDQLTFENKENHKQLLEYIFFILENTTQTDELTPLNIHFEKTYEDHEKDLIAKFIWLYFFEKSYSSEQPNGKNRQLQDKISALQRKVDSPIYLLDNKKLTRKKALETRNKHKAHLKYYKKLKPTVSLIPETVINFQVNQLKSLAKSFNYNPTYLSVSEIKSPGTYVLYNTQSYQDIIKIKIDETEKPLLRLVKNIILFDCENSLQRFLNFNYKRLSDFNRNHKTNFKLFLVITFSRRKNLNSLRTKLTSLKERYYLPDQTSYVISRAENKFLSSNHLNDYNKDISFIGPLTSIFWEEYHRKIQINGLYELRSIKMMNIYSTCYNETIKRYIIEDIYSKRINSNLISKETKTEIRNLPESDIQDLKSLLSNALDVILNSNLSNKIIASFTPQSQILLDHSIIENDSLISLIKPVLNIQSNQEIKTWSELPEKINTSIIVLSYRDQGNYNHNFYPNLNELKVTSQELVKCIFPAVLFKQTYDWSVYNLAKDYHKTLDHPIRRNHFAWSEVKRKIQELKPKIPVNILWDLESDYSGTDVRITYKVKYNGQRRTTTYHPSDLIIYREANRSPRIQTIKWIYDYLENEEIKLDIQKLDDLIEEFNPADKIIDNQQQEKDLEIIRRQFSLGDENPGRLWKILLSQKVEESGTDHVYEELKRQFEQNNISLVSKNSFQDVWTNPESESLLPRGNKVFKILCDYLQLPTAYRRVIYSIKIKTTSGKRNATRIYSRLLKDIFNDGCFDSHEDPKEILSKRLVYYKSNHNLDELGIDDDNPLLGLHALVELIKDELDFTTALSVKKQE